MTTPNAEADSNWDFNTLPGHLRLKPGDVVNVHSGLWMTTRANESGARVVSFDRKEKTITKRVTGESKTIKARAAEMTITTQLEKALVIERRGETGLKEFLAAKQASRRESSEDGGEETNNEESINDNMKTNGATSARGGLAASVAARKSGSKGKGKAKAKVEGEKSFGRLGGYLGHANTAVLVTMGKAGISTNWARDIFKALKLNASENSLSIFTSAGRAVADPKLGHKELLALKTKRGLGADLTVSQINDLKAAAPEPEPEPTAAQKKEAAAAKRAATKAAKVAEKAVKDAEKAEKKAEETAAATT